jgi:hypothetical protein
VQFGDDAAPSAQEIDEDLAEAGGWAVHELEQCATAWEELDREELERFGNILDRCPASLGGLPVGIVLAERLLRVRTREGRTAPLRANVAQREFEARRGSRNIVLKARQMGLTTWASARFFLRTITRPGTLTLQVAHTQESAEEIFRIVHRFLDCLPEELRDGPLRTSRANARQIVFPEMDAQYRVVSAGEKNAGRGLTVQNLHCSELARWPGDPAETLAGLRATLAPGAEPCMAGGGKKQSRQRGAGAGTDRMRLRADLSAGWTGGVADDFDEPAGSAGTPGCNPCRAAGEIHEPAVTGRVQELCASTEWEHRGTRGDA